MDALTIRPARPEDAAAIAHIHVESWLATYPGIVPQPYLDALDKKLFTKRWRDNLTNEEAMSVCVAQVGGVLCGFASGGPVRKPISTFHGELYALYLLPTMQRKGIGRKLFEQMRELLSDRDLEHLMVWILQRNPAVGFYERLGGEQVAEDIRMIGGEPLSLIAYGWVNSVTKWWR